MPSKVDVPTGPPLPQEQCLLFRIPPELRNFIYELALEVEPDSDGEVTLHRQFRKDHPTVLNLLGVCRLINQEAAGIFYSQHKIVIHWNTLCANGDYDHGLRSPGFASTLSRLRLKGLRDLTVTCSGGFENGLEFATMACNRVRSLPALRTLCVRLVRPNRIHQWAERVEVEIPFLKKAVKRLVSVEEMRFEIEDLADREEFMKRLDEVVAVLPHNVRLRSSASC
ncbi:hypothetical protein PRZ48_004429 [Zasmidium cellare]|uniref:F-box domain-containing protein n=1 Tax=Zasmidium cellare TaxID=395010 RepID=A0ABR0EPL3_ZASCE|nr:hypothetical protein PRZ48_004429 [Zasmidium cellare]